MGKVLSIPLSDPHPSFDELIRVLQGSSVPQKVHNIELLVDPEIIDHVVTHMFGEDIPPAAAIEDAIAAKWTKRAKGKSIGLLTTEVEKRYYGRVLGFYHRMGYDAFPDMVASNHLTSLPAFQRRRSLDTAKLSRGTRVWANPRHRTISSWEDFKAFPWECMEVEVNSWYDFLGEHLPVGMKATVSLDFYEFVAAYLVGWNAYFHMLYKERDLIRALYEKCGELVYRLYERIITLDCVGGIFHCDDMGYRTSTMIDPDMLRELVFPWLKRFADLAHRYGKPFWLHCCGNVLSVMDDLIDDVGIDAFHSFQDPIIPVADFHQRYGDRLAVLGGVDVDRLAQLSEQELQAYVRGILDAVMPGGRYALGAGNSITNYIPIENYFAMLDEGANWRPATSS